MSNIGIQLIRLRHDKKLTQVELSKLSGVNQATISNLEKGRHEPTIDTLIRISRALSVPVDALDSRLDGVCIKPTIKKQPRSAASFLRDHRYDHQLQTRKFRK